MDNKAETLARVYALILNTEWGCSNSHENQNVGPAAAHNQDRLLTERKREQRPIQIVPEKISRELGEK